MTIPDTIYTAPINSSLKANNKIANTIKIAKIKILMMNLYILKFVPRRVLGVGSKVSLISSNSCFFKAFASFLASSFSLFSFSSSVSKSSSTESSSIILSSPVVSKSSSVISTDSVSSSWSFFFFLPNILMPPLSFIPIILYRKRF